MQKKEGMLRNGWLTLPTKDRQERRNLLWIFLAVVCAGASASLYGGEVWAAFLVQTGFNSFEIGLIGSVTTLSGAFGLLAFMGLADRIQRRVRTYIICLALAALVPLSLAALAFIPRQVFPLAGFFAAIIGIEACAALVLSIPAMLDYPIWARAFTVGVRGHVFAIVTTAGFLLTFVLGLVIAKVLGKLVYPVGYAGCFLFAAMVIMLRVAAFSRVRELPGLAVAGQSRSPLPFKAIVDVLRMKEFQWLGPPHILRGLCKGIVALAMVMAMKHLKIPGYFAGYATSAMALAFILGGITIWLIADRWGAARTTLLADLIFAVGLGFVMLSDNPLVFLVFYFLLQFGLAVEDSAIPLGCINIVPPERLGAFSSARLMVMSGSGAAGSALFGWLFKMDLNPALIFAMGALLKAASGVWFWYVFSLKKPVNPAAGAAQPPAG